MLALLRKVQTNLSSLSQDQLLARQEVSLQYAHTMLWMAKHYQNIGCDSGMRYCCRIGIESIQEHKRISEYLELSKEAA